MNFRFDCSCWVWTIYQITNIFIGPFFVYHYHKKLACDGQTGKQTQSSSPYFLCDHFTIQVEHIPNFKSLDFTALNISRYLDVQTNVPTNQKFRLFISLKETFVLNFKFLGLKDIVVLKIVLRLLTVKRTYKRTFWQICTKSWNLEIRHIFWHIFKTRTSNLLRRELQVL